MRKQVDLIKVMVPGQTFRRVSLIEPSLSGYLLIAAAVDRRPPFLGASQAKRALLHDCKRLCRQLEKEQGVQASVFRALLMPPRGGPPLKRQALPHLARYDVAILIRTATVEEARELHAAPGFKGLEARVREAAWRILVTTASNAKRIAPVDHHRGVFLFNCFIADDTARNLAVWEYTAGWFQQETGLDNSEVLLPVEGEASPYSIINHCRWDHLSDILPSLLFKRSLRTYVLAHFKANQVTAMPVLYRLA